MNRPLTTANLIDHLAGKTVLGTYIVRGEYARIVVFDIDQTDRNPADAIMKAATIRGAEPILEESGSGRWHVWVLLDHPIRAAKARQWARGVTRLAGTDVEIFPKQDRTDGYGNLIRLPGLHPTARRWSVFHTPIRTTDATRLRIPPADTISAVRTPKPARTGNGPVGRLLRAEIQPGERNTAFHGFGTWCAWTLGLPADLALEWANRLNRALPEPLDADEIRATLNSAYTHQPPEDRP